MENLDKSKELESTVEKFLASKREAVAGVELVRIEVGQTGTDGSDGWLCAVRR